MSVPASSFIVVLDPNYPSMWWAMKAPGETITYGLDLSLRLVNGVYVENLSVNADTSLTVGTPMLSGNTITLQIGGGLPLTNVQVEFVINLSDGDILTPVVTLPIGVGIPTVLVPVSVDDYSTDAAI